MRHPSQWIPRLNVMSDHQECHRHPRLRKLKQISLQCILLYRQNQEHRYYPHLAFWTAIESATGVVSPLLFPFVYSDLRTLANSSARVRP